jgi:uroporphyrin-3 C-methyltransferase
MPAKGKKPKKASSFFTYILLLLVLASMAGVGFLWQQLQHLSADLMKESSYQLDLQAQKQSNTQVQSELETARAQLEENQKTIDVLNQDLKQLKIQIAGISGVNRVDWLVDELQHLTRLAHQRLVLSHDANGAIALLKAADQVVVEMRQSAALPVRQAIASDLLDLRLAADVDLEGAYIRLDSLS